MNIVLSNLVPIFLSFLLGVNHHFFIKKVNARIINKLSNMCLYLLLIFMGMTIGLLPNILTKIFQLGITALAIAIMTSLCIAVTLIIINRKVTKHALNKKDEEKNFNIIEYIKDPIMLTMLVIAGFFLSYNRVVPNIDDDIIVSILLYLMIFFIGVKFSFSGLNLKRIFFNRNYLILTSATILSSCIGAIIISFFIHLNIKNCLAISSGFGWYSLSGILFTKMNNPILGSIAFLCDLFREILALMLIPTLSRIGHSHAAIGVAGATAMDVTLPVIEKHCGNEYIPIAFVSGGIITTLVPFLIPLFYSLS